ncbi:hypothetical protein CK203_063744 [Vitis vinifera]|uniref:Uncharacterized protein n=1 Tax=Vitis vinifera TaxID=29760 RepID=A0A438G4F5_VITVI|nr:hypothetical protein CK203_063744 [Vitis vinifera]
MSTSKTHWRGHEEKNLKGKLAQRLSSFHSGIPMTMAPQAELRRPKTLPNLLAEEFRASLGCDLARFNSRRSDHGGTAAIREGGVAVVSVMN